MTTPLKRWRYGDVNPVVGPFILGTPFNEGDFMFLKSPTITPPDQQTQLPLEPAGQFAMVSALGDPSIAPTNLGVSATNQGPGFTVASTGIAVAYTWVTVDGLESGPSPLSGRMAVNGNACQVSLPSSVVIPANAYKTRWYVTTDGGGAGTLVLAAESFAGVGVVIGGPPASTAAAPPAASSLTSLVMSQIAFNKLFLGVSAQTYPSDLAASAASPPPVYGIRDQYVRVLTAGVFDFSVASATNFNDGDLLGIGTLTGTSLDAQTVAKVPQSQRACAFARVVKGGPSLLTVRATLFGTNNMVAQAF